MDIKQIEALAKVFRSASLTSLEITDGDFHIEMKKDSVPIASVQRTQPQIYECGTSLTDTAVFFDDKSDETAKADAAEKNSPVYSLIKAPLAGVFYDSQSPDVSPFVKIGDKIKKGDVICIIEAMKVMNEINSEKDGEIAEICAKSGQIVEYGQTMFKII